MDEQALLQALRNTETRHRAFTQIVNQYSEKVYWIVRHIVGTHEDADDVVQNTFIKLWNKIDDFRGESKLSTWMHRVAVNEALDFLRREKKHRDNLTDDSVITDRTSGDVSLAGFSDIYFDGDELDKVLRQLDITREELIDMGILIGTDFLKASQKFLYDKLVGNHKRFSRVGGKKI